MAEQLRLEQDRLAVQRSRNARLRAALIDVLEAPWLGGQMPAITRTNACYEVEHKARRPDGQCVCGKEKP
jgi:hypothetical protein